MLRRWPSVTRRVRTRSRRRASRGSWARRRSPIRSSERAAPWRSRPGDHARVLRRRHRDAARRAGSTRRATPPCSTSARSSGASLPDVPFRRTVPTGAIWAGDRLVVVGATCPGYVGAEHGCTGGKTVAAVYSADDRSWRKRLGPAVPAWVLRRAGAALRRRRSAATFLIGGTFTVRLDLARDRWTRVRSDLDGSMEATCAAQSFAAYTGGAPPSLRLLAGPDRSWGVPETPATGPLDRDPAGVHCRQRRRDHR